MTFHLEPMEYSEALAISRWHYAEPYSFYDFSSDSDDLKELLDGAQNGPVSFYSVFNEVHELAGFFEFTMNEGFIEIGLGMRPDLTGKGTGLSFLRAGLSYLLSECDNVTVRLKVASFNLRARKVYERAGFTETGLEKSRNKTGSFDFVTMELNTHDYMSIE